MKKVIFGIVICTSIFGQRFISFAQKITLNEAIQKGIENRIELKTQALNIEIANSENDKIKAKWLPQVSASGDVRWNTACTRKPKSNVCTSCPRKSSS
jgi:outer membrane protein TolC